MRASRVVLLVVGIVVGLAAMGFGAGGAALIWIHNTQRDADGFYSTPTHRLETVTAAITSRRVALGGGPDRSGWGPLRRDWLTVRLRVDSADPVFIGIAPAADVEAYLAGVAHDEIDDIDRRPTSVTYTRVPGRAEPATRPADETFWVAAASGTGQQELRWDTEPGRWSVVVMNADGSRSVSVDASAGVRTTLLLPIGIGLVVAMIPLFGISALLLYLAVRDRGAVGPTEAAPTERAAPTLPPPVPQEEAEGSTAVYPARLDGRLDSELSRGLWLVKWILVIPHLIVLFFLWLALFILTVVAGISIAFTGRYPRGIFDFNVGVIRWSWRVTFYAFTLGTDRYPPFTLEPDATYPASFDVEYPERLSRGLVWVKWWLLALPHYLIVGVFGGGFTWISWQIWNDGAGAIVFSGGLIGLLVLIAAVILLFTARYPEPIFDMVMGLQRWVHRVLVYAALMRDEYPPFDLVPGGTDPLTREER